jgi:hypothetical protein
MTIPATNLHPRLTIKTEQRNAQQGHNDDFDYWRSFLLKTINGGGIPIMINDNYDVVRIYRHNKLLHTHYLMYSDARVNAVYSTFNLMQQSEAFTSIVLANMDQPLKKETLNFVFTEIADLQWDAKIESKKSHVTLQL